VRHELLLGPHGASLARDDRAAARAGRDRERIPLRDALALPNTLVVGVSQSGETADTLAALKYAQALGHIDTLAVCNVPTSAMVRQTSLRFLTRAGPRSASRRPRRSRRNSSRCSCWR
jgi:N-acetylmuramic acid 6-phosphate (MurNAc-6-P) etherase